MRATLLEFDAVGQIWRGLSDDSGCVFRLEIERWSERDRRARLNDIWLARLQARQSGDSWFADLGIGGIGLLKEPKSKKLAEGSWVEVRIRAEAYGEKGARLEFVSAAKSSDNGGPCRISVGKDDSLLLGCEILETIDGPEACRELAMAIDEARNVRVDCVGDITLWIESTRALTIVDVDYAGTGLLPGQSRSKANMAAAREIALQLALRGIGGLVAIDFIGAPRGSEQITLEGVLKMELKARLGRKVDVLGLSRFGLCQIAVERRQRSLEDALASVDAEEAEALDVLREIELVGIANRGARILAKVSGGAEGWLEANKDVWQEALAGRIGARWTITSDERALGAPDVWSEQ